MVFDGGSFCVHPKTGAINQFTSFEEGLFITDIKKEKQRVTLNSLNESFPKISSIDQTYRALVLGLRDYVEKNGFQKVALGISGGIDSALVATLAVHAIGAERVVGVTMPSQFNSKATISDSHQLARP